MKISYTLEEVRLFHLYKGLHLLRLVSRNSHTFFTMLQKFLKKQSILIYSKLCINNNK